MNFKSFLSFPLVFGALIGFLNAQDPPKVPQVLGEVTVTATKANIDPFMSNTDPFRTVRRRFLVSLQQFATSR
jgi:hypothetical protein